MPPHQPQDHHAILGVAPTATWEEIRAAFRARAKALHPDTNRHRDTREDFQRLREAYVVLRRVSHPRPGATAEPFVERSATARAPTPKPTPPPRWPWQKKPLTAMAIAGVALALLSFAIQGWIVRERSVSPMALAELEKELQATLLAQLTQSEAEVPNGLPLIGRAGRTYVVSADTYERLHPIYARLTAEQEDLQQRKTQLHLRRDALEKEYSALSRSNPAEAISFQHRANAFNHDVATLRSRFEVHASRMESYFKQIERAGTASR